MDYRRSDSWGWGGERRYEGILVSLSTARVCDSHFHPPCPDTRTIAGRGPQFLSVMFQILAPVGRSHGRVLVAGDERGPVILAV